MMKNLFNVLLLLICFHLSYYSYGQVQPIGLVKEVYTPESKFFQKSFFPRCQINNDTIFVSTNDGIYKKKLTIDSDWELYAFENTPITEFVRNGDQIIAISPGSQNGDRNLLLLSNDNGKSYVDYTSSHFFRNGQNFNYIRRITQNPLNPNSLLVCHLNGGISKSIDFGKNWMLLNDMGLEWYVNFHPLDTTNIFFAGETDAFQGTIYRSFDDGYTWDDYIYPSGDNSIHHIAFHPTEQNILVYAGEGVIAKSIDKGTTWKLCDLKESGMYFYKVLFGDDNILYASGLNRSGINDAIFVYRSIDLGETWHLAYNEKLNSDCGGVLDMIKYNDKLIFYTRKMGLFELDLKKKPSLNNESINSDHDIEIFQNLSGYIRFKSTEIIRHLDILDLSGKILKRVNISDIENSISTSHLQKGTYFFVFYTEKRVVTKKVLI